MNVQQRGLTRKHKAVKIPSAWNGYTVLCFLLLFAHSITSGVPPWEETDRKLKVFIKKLSRGGEVGGRSPSSVCWIHSYICSSWNEVTVLIHYLKYRINFSRKITSAALWTHWGVTFPLRSGEGPSPPITAVQLVPGSCVLCAVLQGQEAYSKLTAAACGSPYCSFWAQVSVCGHTDKMDVFLRPGVFMLSQLSLFSSQFRVAATSLWYPEQYVCHSCWEVSHSSAPGSDHFKQQLGQRAVLGGRVWSAVCRLLSLSFCSFWYPACSTPGSFLKKKTTQPPSLFLPPSCSSVVNKSKSALMNDSLPNAPLAPINDFGKWTLCTLKGEKLYFDKGDG